MAKSQDERRTAVPRNRVLLSGKLVFDNGARSMDCIIRDKTKSGARVKLSSAEVVPSRVYLIDVKHGQALDAEVIWVKPGEIGLKFLKTHDLRDHADDPAVKGVRRIWLELAAR